MKRLLIEENWLLAEFQTASKNLRQIEKSLNASPDGLPTRQVKPSLELLLASDSIRTRTILRHGRDKRRIRRRSVCLLGVVFTTTASAFLLAVVVTAVRFLSAILMYLSFLIDSRLELWPFLRWNARWRQVTWRRLKNDCYLRAKRTLSDWNRSRQETSTARKTPPLSLH